MDDLIKRSDAIEAIEVVDWYHQNRNKDMVSGAGAEDQPWYKAEDIYKALEAVPSADRPQGEWRAIDRTWGRENWICTHCSDVVVDMPTYKGIALYAYCPNCGAKMKGADDE